jgi:TRAP-type mannitol/chloroaromatic compound transport system permease small subunit
VISKTSSGPFVQNALYAIDKISEWSAKVTGYLVAIVALLVALEGSLRYFFNKPTTWSAELVTYLSGAVYCLGVAYVHQLGEHVKVDVFWIWLRSRFSSCSLVASFGQEPDGH